MTDEKKTEHKSLALAMVAAQARFPRIKKSRIAEVFSKRTSSKYQYFYADLNDVLHAVRPILNEEGLFLSQATRLAENGLVIVTTIKHGVSGEEMVSEWPLSVASERPQEIGSDLTYFRRYAITTMLGVAAEESVDETASGEIAKKTAARKEPLKGGPMVTGKLGMSALKDAAKALHRDIHACGDAEELASLLGTQESMDLMDQVRKDLQTWWYGDAKNPDAVPLNDLINNRRKELARIEDGGISQ